MEPSVYIQSGSQSGAKVVVRSGVTTFGRSSANAVQLLDREVSRQHFELVFEGDSVWVRDLGSVNGTYVNGTRTNYRQLLSGDVIAVGRTELLFTGGRESRGGNAGLRLSVQLVRESEGSAAEEAFSDLTVPGAVEPPGGTLRSREPRLALELAAKSRQNLDFLQEAFQSLGTGLSVEELFARILEQIFAWVNVDRACILIGGNSSDDFVVTAARLRQPSGDSTMRVSRSILRYVQSRNVGVLTHDARDDSRWEDSDPSGAFGVHEAICVPLLGRSELLGAVYVDTCLRPGELNPAGRRVLQEEHLQTMLAVGKLAGLALENARYSEELVAKTKLAAIGETIASLSHHIKNILQGISSGTFLLEQGLLNRSPADTHRGWEIVRRYQESISRLVLDMLSYSRERQPERTVANLNQTIAECVELVRPRAASIGVEIDWEPHGELQQFAFDPFAISHAVNNLLQNAVDACEQKGRGRVTVRIALGGFSDRVRIVVQDNGSGIEPGELDRIFQLFHSTKGNRGTGLGLAVSRKIVREHGGEIEVESQPGLGSRFVIALPQAEQGRHEENGLGAVSPSAEEIEELWNPARKTEIKPAGSHDSV